jgi:hypothetical protein
MFFVKDPGPWQYYVNRKDNIGLSLDAVRRKYLTESIAFEEQMSQWVMQSQNYSNASGGTADTSTSDSSLPSNCIEFVFNTTLGTEASVNFTTSGPVEYTLNWGDSTIDSGTADGESTNGHEYADADQSYTCLLCFDNAGLVSALEFVGDAP